MAATTHSSEHPHDNAESEFAVWVFVVILLGLACYATFLLWDRVQAY
jgi:hypothetical protein